MHAWRVNKAVDECDLLFVVGACLDDRATGKLDGFAPTRKTSTSTPMPPRSITLRPTGAARRPELLGAFIAVGESLAIADWVCDARPAHHRWLPRITKSPAPSPPAIRQLSRIAPDDTVACDVGQHQMWVAQHYSLTTSPTPHQRGRHHGLRPAGGHRRAVCRPNSTVINVTATPVHDERPGTGNHPPAKLPLKLIILDNQCRAVRQQQELFYNNWESRTTSTTTRISWPWPAPSISRPCT